ncbi:MAG: hypothetical protein SRB2_03270 [Desulfobacteraceae bacterium Eth-SRB2]|nr:MAG: hypothetical protein SRB2_03270 [Desulfobacteraceae bacterium Eth-SRB2]
MIRLVIMKCNYKKIYNTTLCQCQFFGKYLKLGHIVVLKEKNKRRGLNGKKELAEVRGRLGKTQKQISQLIDTSLKAIKNFEQGWRNIFLYIEKQILFLLAMKNTTHSIFQRLQTSLFNCNGMALSSPPWHFGIDVC